MDEIKTVVPFVMGQDDPGGKSEDSFSDFSAEKEQWLETELKYNPIITVKQAAFQMGVAVSRLQQFCMANYGYPFNEIKDFYINETKGNIIKKQFKRALEGGGDGYMLIHLGRQYCGQVDNPQPPKAEPAPIRLAYIPKSERVKKADEGNNS